MSHPIFISYRRDDVAGDARHLRERLATVFGANSVFMDVDDVAPGEDFENLIRRTIRKCSVLIVVIGSNWEPSGSYRSGHTTMDYVHLEIETALRYRCTIIPVLVDAANMPPIESLPTSITALARFSAFDIRHTRFDDDVSMLIDRLKQLGVVEKKSIGRWLAPAHRGLFSKTAIGVAVLFTLVAILVLANMSEALSARFGLSAGLSLGATATIVIAFCFFTEGEILSDFAQLAILSLVAFLFMTYLFSQIV